MPLNGERRSSEHMATIPMTVVNPDIFMLDRMISRSCSLSRREKKEEKNIESICLCELWARMSAPTDAGQGYTCSCAYSLLGSISAAHRFHLTRARRSTVRLKVHNRLGRICELWKGMWYISIFLPCGKSWVYGEQVIGPCDRLATQLRPQQCYSSSFFI
jgi:hypothetical protein